MISLGVGCRKKKLLNRSQTSKVAIDSRQVKLAVGHQEMNFENMFDG